MPLKLGIKLQHSVENGKGFYCVIRCFLGNTGNTPTINEFSGSVPSAQNLAEVDSHRLLVIAQVEGKLDNIICTQVLYT